MYVLVHKMGKSLTIYSFQRHVLGILQMRLGVNREVPESLLLGTEMDILSKSAHRLCFCLIRLPSVCSSCYKSPRHSSSSIRKLM